jgi:lipoprotein-anchoring transpeptidase ErfK/SrfK
VPPLPLGHHRNQHFSGDKSLNRIRISAAAALALALAACSTTPPPAPVAPPVVAARPSMAPYVWTAGNAPKAHEEMLAIFGKSALTPGQYLWVPSIPAAGDTRVVVDLYKQMAFVYRADQLIGVTTISSGKKGRETPLGYWTILSKRPMYYSRKYDNAPMPFMQSIDDHGIALHAGKTPGYPASHGCVRLPPKFAQKLYTLTKIGSKVVIEG